MRSLETQVFRDRLRSNPTLVEEYNQIKYDILKRVVSGNRKEYVEMNENVIMDS